MKEGLTPSKIDQILAKIKPHPVVALVDDDEATLDLLERTLGPEGYEIHCFTSAEDLLGKFSQLRPDLIVMEAVLPGMSGLSVLEELRPRHVEAVTPILILSQKDDLRAKLLAFKRGALDYLTKPFDTDEVVARVRALIRSKVLQDLIRISSLSDPLTSLYNRRFLATWLNQEIERAKRYQLDLGCLLMDLDNFKMLNEEKGERAGDKVLREFSGLIQVHVRGSDLVGRFENDEFLVLLPGTSKEGARVVGHRIRGLAAKQDLPSFCTGIVSYDAREMADSECLLQKASEALAKARSVGLGQTAVV